MHILVTGSEGGVGRSLIPLLEAQGHTVRGLDIVEKAHGDYEYVPGDLRDFDTVRRCVSGVSAVVHAGAIPYDRKDQEAAVLASNAQGTWNVLVAAVKEEVSRVIHFSSINALGCVGGRERPLYLPVDDVYPRHPNSPYQIGKHLAEEACKAFSRRWGIITISLRPMWISQEPPRTREAATDDSEEEQMWSELWAYVDMRDICDATLRSLTVEGIDHKAFLLAADDTMATVPTAELVERHLADIPWRIPPGEWFAENPYRGLLDCSAAKRILGWQPRHSLWETPPPPEDGPAK